LELLENRHQYLIPEVDRVDSHILSQLVHECKAFDSPEGDQHAFVRAHCAARASWQLLVQRQPNETWPFVDECPQLIASDNILKVILLLLAEDTKERSGALYPLIPQFAGQHMEDRSELSRLHVQGYGQVLTDCRGRQAQILNNRTDRGEWLMAEACQNSRIYIVKRRAAMLRFVLHV
jgi:hypothetical protein